jgi:isopenicillin N synthase-like dioxygenase
VRIPIVDLGPGHAGGSGRRAAAASIARAAGDSGFFYVVGHGVPATMLAGQLDCARRFFVLPADVKDAVAMRRSPCRRGYEPAATQVLHAGTRPDLKESFYVGRDLAPSHPYVVAGLPNHGANVWPALPGFRAHTERYFSHLLELSGRLMSLIAASLGLPDGWFEPMHREPMPILRLLHYAPHPAHADDDQFGAGAHTDWGAVTLLLQDDAGGLEVRMPDGEWVAADPVPGSFVVNLGDMMERWTNGRYRSNLHRVINRSPRDRYSVAFFANPDPLARVECLPGCSDAQNPPRYAPCTAGEHIDQMYRRTFSRAA